MNPTARIHAQSVSSGAASSPPHGSPLRPRGIHAQSVRSGAASPLPHGSHHRPRGIDTQTGRSRAASAGLPRSRRRPATARCAAIALFAWLALSAVAPAQDPAPGRSVESLLDDATFDLDLPDAPLRDAVRDFSWLTGVPCRIDERALPNSEALRVSLHLQGATARRFLDTVCEDLGIGWRVDDDLVVLTTEDAADDDTETRVHDVRKLLARRARHGGEGRSEEAERELLSFVRAFAGTETWDDDPRAAVELRDGALVVRQTSEVQEQVERVLGLLDVCCPHPVGVEWRIVERAGEGSEKALVGGSLEAFPEARSEGRAEADGVRATVSVHLRAVRRDGGDRWYAWIDAQAELGAARLRLAAGVELAPDGLARLAVLGPDGLERALVLRVAAEPARTDPARLNALVPPDLPAVPDLEARLDRVISIDLPEGMLPDHLRRLGELIGLTLEVGPGAQSAGLFDRTTNFEVEQVTARDLLRLIADGYGLICDPRPWGAMFETEGALALARTLEVLDGRGFVAPGAAVPAPEEIAEEIRTSGSRETWDDPESTGRLVVDGRGLVWVQHSPGVVAGVRAYLTRRRAAAPEPIVLEWRGMAGEEAAAEPRSGSGRAPGDPAGPGTAAGDVPGAAPGAGARTAPGGAEWPADSDPRVRAGGTLRVLPGSPAAVAWSDARGSVEVRAASAERTSAGAVRVALRMEWADGEGRTALLEEVAEVARDRVWTRRAEGPAGAAGVVLVVRVRGR